MLCCAGLTAPVSLIPVGTNNDHGRPAPGTQQAIANTAQQNCIHRHQLPSRGSQQATTATTTSGPTQGNGAGPSSHMDSGIVRQIQRPRASCFIPPRKIDAPRISKALAPPADPQSNSRPHLSSAASAVPQAPGERDPDALAGSSSPTSHVLTPPVYRSLGDAPAVHLIPKQQPAGIQQPGSAQSAASEASKSEGARCERSGAAASQGLGQAAQNRAAAGLPFARRRLVKAAQLPLPDTQVYEHPCSSLPFYSASSDPAGPPSSAKPCNVLSRTKQAARSPVHSPQDGPGVRSPGRRYSPGAVDGKRQRCWSDVADNARQSHSLEHLATPAAPASPGMPGMLL